MIIMLSVFVFPKVSHYNNIGELYLNIYADGP
jgi:hypothetical protein